MEESLRSMQSLWNPTTSSRANTSGRRDTISQRTGNTFSLINLGASKDDIARCTVLQSRIPCNIF